MKDDRAECTTHECTKKVGTKCQYCLQLCCDKHSFGVGKERVCHRCLEALKDAPGSFTI